MDSFICIRDKINILSLSNNSLSKLKSFRFLSLICILLTIIVTVSYVMLYKEGSLSTPWLQISAPYCDYNKSDEKIITLWNESTYNKHDLSPRDLWTHNCNISYQNYFDLNFAEDCGIPYQHEQLFNLLKFWINLTAEHNIPWWLCYGSLIGALRHKDMVPWDSDIDIEMPVQFESLIRNLSTSRKDISHKKVNIITRPGAHCPYNGPRMDCKGNVVTSHVDGCAFCGPFARIFFSSSKRIDIYLVDIKFHKGKLKLAEEGIFEYTTEMPYNPLEWFLPLRNCSFMGLTLQCPRQSEVLLRSYYKTYHSYYKCENKEWVLIKSR